MYPEKYTQLIVSVKINGYKTSLPAFNPIVRPRSIAGFNAPAIHSTLLRPGSWLQRGSPTINQRKKRKQRNRRRPSSDGPTSPLLRIASCRASCRIWGTKRERRAGSHRPAPHVGCRCLDPSPMAESGLAASISCPSSTSQGRRANAPRLDQAESRGSSTVIDIGKV